MTKDETRRVNKAKVPRCLGNSSKILDFIFTVMESPGKVYGYFGSLHIIRGPSVQLGVLQLQGEGWICRAGSRGALGTIQARDQGSQSQGGM